MTVLKRRRGRALAGLGLLAMAPLFFGFLCFPLVAPAPSGVVTPTPAATFAPTVSANVSTSLAGVPSDVQAHLSLPAGSTLAIGAAFDVPAGWGVAADGDVTDGAIAGTIVGAMTVDDPAPLPPFTFFGCTTTVDFNAAEGTDIKLLEATTATSPTVSGADTDTDGKPDVIEDTDGNGLPDGVDRYPEFLTVLLPPVLNDLGATVHARYFGHTEAAGISDLYVNVLVLELAPGGPYRVLTITNDPTSRPESATNRFCAPQTTTMTLSGMTQDNPNTLLANEGGQGLYTNPSVSGTYPFGAALVSEFDHDNDGASNGFDNCPFTPNANQADTDKDYVGDACDSFSNTANFDVDGDGIENGYDNCLFTANTAQADSDFDDLGDVCDPNANTPNGPNYYLSCEDPVGIGTGDPGGATCGQGTPTPVVPTPTPTPKDPDGDTDGDTIPNSEDPDDDNDGCTDEQELQPKSAAALGGGRDPHNFWDFFDVPTGNELGRDGAIVGTDIAAVVARFGSTGDSTGDPLSTPPRPPSYHTAYDRGGSEGPNPWNLRPADGAIVGQDIAASVGQFGHVCSLT